MIFMGNRLNFLVFCENFSLGKIKAKAYQHSCLVSLFGMVVFFQTGCGALHRFFDDLQKEKATENQEVTAVSEPDLLIKPIGLQYDIKLMSESEEEIGQSFQMITKLFVQYTTPQKNLQFTYPKGLKLKALLLKQLSEYEWFHPLTIDTVKQSSIAFDFKDALAQDFSHVVDLFFDSKPLAGRFLIWAEFEGDWQGLAHIKAQSEEGLYRTLILSKTHQLFPMLYHSTQPAQLRLNIPEKLQAFSSHAIGQNTWQYQASLPPKAQKTSNHKDLEMEDPSLRAMIDEPLNALSLNTRSHPSYDSLLFANDPSPIVITIGPFHPILDFKLNENRHAVMLVPKTTENKYDLIKQAKKRIQGFDAILDQFLPKPIKPLIFMLQPELVEQLDPQSLQNAAIHGFISIPEVFVLTETDQPMLVKRKTDFELLKRMIAQRLSPWLIKNAQPYQIEGMADWLAHQILPLTTEDINEKLIFEEYLEQSLVDRFIKLSTYANSAQGIISNRSFEYDALKYAGILTMVHAYIDKEGTVNDAIRLMISHARAQINNQIFLAELHRLYQALLFQIIEPIMLLSQQSMALQAVLQRLKQALGSEVIQTELTALWVEDEEGLLFNLPTQAPQDLIQLINEKSKLDVSGIINRFEENQHLPLLEVDYECAENPPQSTSPLVTPHPQSYEVKFYLSQSPYQKKMDQQAQLGTQQEFQPWQLPVCLTFATEDDKIHHRCVLLKEEKQSFRQSLKSCPTWVHPNRNQQLLYYWKLKNTQHLLKASQKLTPAEWGVLPELFFALLESNHLYIDDYLNLIDEYAKNSQGKIVWFSVLAQHLNMISHLFVEPTVLAEFQYWTRSLLRHFLPKTQNQMLVKDEISLGFAWLGGKGVNIPNYEADLEEFLNFDEKEIEEGEGIGEPILNYPGIQVFLLLKMSKDQSGELSQRVMRRLAISEIPLLREICLEAMAHSSHQESFKTLLDFLLKTEESNQNEAFDFGNKEKPNHLEGTEKSLDQAIPKLFLSDTEKLFFVKKIKQSKNRAWAWAWFYQKLKQQEKEKNKEKNNHDPLAISDLSLIMQAQMLQWADIGCDEASNQALQAIQKDQLMGNAMESLGKVFQNTQMQIQRCRFLRKNFASQATLWFKEKTRRSTP